MIVVENLRQGYVDVCQQVLRRGWPVEPRGKLTRELVGEQIRILDPLDALPTGINRKVSPRFAAVEACQLIAGRSYPGLMVEINPNMEQFLEDGKFHGAYGPRIRRSIRKAVENLRHDRDSRQALVNIWSADQDLFVRTKDVPCTLTLQYLIRSDVLWAITSMRSNDVWWGLAYDAFQFTQLQVTIARVLGIEPGPYIHNAASLHAYQHDWEAIEALEDSSSPKRTPYPEGIPGSTMEDAQNRATRVLMGNAIADASAETYEQDSVAWYARRLHGAD